MDNHNDLYHKNMLALGFVIRQGAARVRRRWYHESGANFDTIDNYEYDAARRLLKTVEADQWFQCVYSYDAAGRIMRRTHSPVDASDPNPPTIYEFSYDAAGRMTLERMYYEDYDEPDTETTFTYDNQDRVVASYKLYLNADDSATGDYRFTYDAEGRLHTITETFSRGSSSVSTYYYNEQDRLILIYKHDSYGRSAITIYEYIVETPEGAVIVNKDFADGKQLVANFG